MRIEIDSLGKREMPSGCLYGIRTARCVENTDVGSASLSSYPELIRALAIVKRACASANVQSGFLTEELGRLIFDACDEILLQAGKSTLDQSFRCQFPVDMLHGGGYIGFNTNINEVLANIANIKAWAAPGAYRPVDQKLHVNLHQSTADACASAARLAIAERWDTLREALSLLKESLSDLGKRYMEVETVARTCMMDAMPVSFGSTFDAWAVLVGRRSKAVQAAVDELRHVNLGGKVIGCGRGAPDAYKEKIRTWRAESQRI